MSNSRTRQAGFGATLVVLAILAVLIIGGVTYVVVKKSADKSGTTSTVAQDAKDTITDTTPGQIDVYEGWKTYSNDKYGFSFRYPQEWQVKEVNPATSTLEAQKAEFVLWLVNETYKTSPEQVSLIVSSNSKEQNIDILEGDIVGHARGEVDKYRSISSETVSGKEAVKYTIGQSKTANREVYFLSGGAKSYVLGTTNEDENIERSSTYISDFDKLVKSLQIK